MTRNTAAALDRALMRALKKIADPDRAVQQQAYMKSEMPFLGVVAPDLRRAAKQVFNEYPLADEASWLEAILTLWRDARYREQRHASIQLAGHPPYRDWLTPRAVPVLEEMVVTGAWWDFVDALATNQFSKLLSTYPEVMKPLLKRWATDDDIWRRRTAILSQLKFKTDTDEALLFHAIEASMVEREFFLRKAIGWALREYSKTKPQVVIDYIKANAGTLSGLSKREGLKALMKQGVVDSVP
jgi:3-methyladenine DNA glycosylase AlkD